MPAESTTSLTPPAAHSPATAQAAPPAIRVEGLKKAFRIPTHRIDSFKERMVHPFAAREYRALQALDGVSFEIRQGEFFGIVGRNGSGKSTLLKLLASIYKADEGSIQIAGRLAPFIELGVGFNVELSARENVVLNGVMMGLTPRETRHRLDAVLEFAELQDFVDLKLKNYSSGMLVRLAFSVMLQADADVLLIDEVLAVGDAAFQQKCADAFRTMKGEGKTIVLVTHEMATVEAYCHRAMLIDGGHVQKIGDPAEVGRQYLKLNFEREAETGGTGPAIAEELQLRDVWLEGPGGNRATSVEQGEPIRLRVELETVEEAPSLNVGFIVANADGLGIAQFGEPIGDLGQRIPAGRRISVAVELQNALVSGRYFVHLGVERREGGGSALYAHNALDFVVFGGQPRGIVALEHKIDAEIEGEGQ